MFRVLLAALILIWPIEKGIASAAPPPKKIFRPLPANPSNANTEGNTSLKPPTTLDVKKRCQVSPTGRVRILSIDGGGVRGLIPAIIVADMEKKLGLSITDVFDAFIGNSAGGILSLLLTKPDISGKNPAFSAEQIVEKIKALSASLFGGTQKTILDKTKATFSKAKNFLTTGAQYSPSVLEKTAIELFGSTEISKSVKPVFVATYDLNSEQTLVLSDALAKKSKLFNFKMADIARATSAAPFYFPVHPLSFTNTQEGEKTAMQLIDGGVGSNNPTLVGIIEVSKEYCDPPAFDILSLGTGKAKHRFETQDMSQKKGTPLLMLKPTINGFMSAQAQNAEDSTKMIIKLLNTFNPQKSYYTRLQVSLPLNDKKLDDVREETTENLSKKAQEIIMNPQYQQTLFRLQKQLCNEGVYRKKKMHEQKCNFS